jgi:hypothetical protein
MSDITYKTGASVAQIRQHNEELAAQPAQTEPVQTPVTTPVQETTPAVQATPVTTAPDTPAVITPDTPAAVVPEPEKNVSKFNIGFDEPVTTTQSASTQSAPQSTFNLDEEIKKVDIKELLKKAGISDFAIEIDQHMKNGGRAEDYLNAKAIDYTKISDDSLLKSDLRKQYPTLQPHQIDLMFERKYSPLTMDENDVEFANIQKQADAYKVRQTAIAEQQKFKIAEPIQQQPDNTFQERQAEALRQAEESRRWFNEHEATKALMTSKRVALNLGENGTFNFEVSQPDFIMKAITDPATWGKLTATKTGEPDVVKLQKIVLYAANPEQYENDLVNYGKTLKLPELVDEGRNITKPNNVIPMQSMNQGKVDWNAAKTGKVGG